MKEKEFYNTLNWNSIVRWGYSSAQRMQLYLFTWPVNLNQASSNPMNLPRSLSLFIHYEFGHESFHRFTAFDLSRPKNRFHLTVWIRRFEDDFDVENSRRARPVDSSDLFTSVITTNILSFQSPTPYYVQMLVQN